MKYFLCPLVILLVLSCAQQRTVQRDIELYDVRGKVRELSLYHYSAVEENGDIVRGEPNAEQVGEQDQTITFNKKGNAVEVYFHGETDSLDHRVVRHFNDRDLCAGETYYDAGGNISDLWVWKYDADGNNTERCRMQADSTFKTYHFLYYDNDHHPVARKSLWFDSNLFDSLRWELDTRGRRIRETHYGYYGLRGINEISYEGNSDRISAVRRYDEIRELTDIIALTYDEKGNLTELRRLRPDSTLLNTVRYDHELDERGNWVTRIEFMDGAPVNYYEREIIYY